MEGQFSPWFPISEAQTIRPEMIINKNNNNDINDSSCSNKERIENDTK